MRFVKLFFLFLPIFLFTTMASAKAVFGIQSESITKQQTKFTKSGTKGFALVNLLIEETDNSEDEDDSHEVSFFHLPLSSEFTYPHVGAIAVSNAQLTYSKVIHNTTPLFIQFRNIRL
ncbi:MAG: hypothetical protein ACKOXC_07220 [Aquirufa sp.]